MMLVPIQLKIKSNFQRNMSLRTNYGLVCNIEYHLYSKDSFDVIGSIPEKMYHQQVVYTVLCILERNCRQFFVK